MSIYTQVLDNEIDEVGLLLSKAAGLLQHAFMVIIKIILNQKEYMFCICIINLYEEEKIIFNSYFKMNKIESKD
jgi:hypothetical protein